MVAKSLLPHYDVFDEKRYFFPGPEKQNRKIEINNTRMGISICEDLWFDHHESYNSYDFDPREYLLGCDLVLNISASPYHHYKQSIRHHLLAAAVKKLQAPVVYVNQVGGVEEIIFDGSSAVFLPQQQWGVTPVRFRETILYWEWEKTTAKRGTVNRPQDNSTPTTWTEGRDAIADLYQALVLGVRDFFNKQGFEKALLGLSGGIDSALVATIAAQALGKERVLGVTLPSAFSSKGSIEDSLSLAHNLGLEIKTLPIKAIHKEVQSTLGTLGESFAEPSWGVTEENVQARIRGLLLMALSNKWGHLLLTTGNKSELAVGYCTLYGDTNGGLGVIGDVYKTEVVALAKWINRTKVLIPWNTIDKPPSAELRPGQKDSDSLPDYQVLDGILFHTIEHPLEAPTIAHKLSLDIELVRDIQKKVHANEYKRFQSPPILRVSPKAFGRGRRYPLVKSSHHLV